MQWARLREEKIGDENDYENRNHLFPRLRLGIGWVGCCLSTS